MSYFQVGDYVRHKSFSFTGEEGFVVEVTETIYRDLRSEIVQVRTNEGLWSVPWTFLIPITPPEEEIARRVLGEDYL